MTTVPLIEPIPVDAIAKFIRPAASPMVKVLPRSKMNDPEIVTVLPKASPEKVQSPDPETVKLFNVTLGTPVIVPPVWVAGITTSAPAPGTTAGLQFAAVFQSPPPTGCQVWALTNTVELKKRSRRIITGKSPILRHLPELTVICVLNGRKNRSIEESWPTIGFESHLQPKSNLFRPKN